MTADPRGWSDEERAALRLVCAALTAAVFLQRFALGGGTNHVPVLLLVVWSLVAIGSRCGALRVDRRAAALLAAMFLAVNLTAFANTVLGRSWSIPSLAYVLVLYAPFALTLVACTDRVRDRALDFFCRLMAVMAAVAVGQLSAQFLGWQYRDLLFDELPGWLVMPGFVTSYPLTWDSEIWRANGVVFLEASFLSQYLALAAVIHLARGGGTARLLLYLAGLVAAVSGTGPILLAVGLTILVFQRCPGVLRRVGVLIATGAVALVALPVGPAITGRLGEFGRDGSSASVRFEEPYVAAGQVLASGPAEILVGLGPGAATAVVEQSPSWARADGDGAPFTPSVPKLVIEYGVVVAGLFVVVVVALVSRGTPPWLALPLLAVYFVLSGSVLQPAVLVPIVALGRWTASAPVRSLPGVSENARPGLGRVEVLSRPAGGPVAVQ